MSRSDLPIDRRAAGRRTQVIASLAAVDGGAVWLNIVGGAPSWLHPVSFPLFVLWCIHPLMVLVPAVGLVALAWPMLAGELRVRPLARALAGLIAALDVAWLLDGHALGIECQGLAHVIAVSAMNGAWLVALLAVGLANRRHPAWRTNVAFHLLFGGGLAWLAFPWFGDMP